MRQVVAIRCTQTLLARIAAPSAATDAPTTCLGDWYATLVTISHQRLILLISEHSRLPVVMAARDVKHLGANFPGALARVLGGLGIPPAVVEREVKATREAVIAKAESRSLLGTLNDYSFLLKWELRNEPAGDLVEWALRLGRTPVRPMGPPGFPDERTRELLA